MPYLDPSTVLERFSRFAVTELRPVVPDDEQFVAAQVGSMASTLQFLSGELATNEAAVDRQTAALETAIPAVEAVLDDRELQAPAVRDALRDASEATGADGDLQTRETACLDATDNVLAAIDSDLAGANASAARRPVYDVLDGRLEAQHAMLGREPVEGGDE